MASPSAKYDFTGKVSLITGSSAGIGAAIAIQLARNGSFVTITGRNAENLEKIAQQIEKVSNGVTPLQIVGDLPTDLDLPEKLVRETVAKYGRLDFVVNNAGVALVNETFDNVQLMEQYDLLMGLNVRSVLELTQHSVPHLEKTKGEVVNISSIASFKPVNDFFELINVASLIYSTSKAAVDMLTKTSAGQLAPKGIRVNVINLGPVFTSAGRTFGIENYFRENEELLKGMTSLKRVAEPEEIAQLAAFLLSELAKNITVSIIVSDGGTLVKTF